MKSRAFCITLYDQLALGLVQQLQPQSAGPARMLAPIHRKAEIAMAATSRARPHILQLGLLTFAQRFSFFSAGVASTI